MGVATALDSGHSSNGRRRERCGRRRASPMSALHRSTGTSNPPEVVRRASRLRADDRGEQLVSDRRFRNDCIRVCFACLLEHRDIVDARGDNDPCSRADLP